MNATATVEVLTAEVRVLQVGSRQVTMSVYRQLDHVSPTDIEPFGRVSDAKDISSAVWVVGSDRWSGALVRSARWIHEIDMRVEREYQQPWIGIGPEFTRRLRLDKSDEFFDTQARQIERRVRAASREWQALPLIVLAGLR